MEYPTNHCCAIVLILALSACTDHKGGVGDKDSARALAERAFLEATKKSITSYSINAGEHENGAWVFFFQGEGEFQRPGYHWIVEVTDAGQTKVLDGQ